MLVDIDGNLNTTGTINSTSDRNQKQDFAEIDPEKVLEKVVALPVQTWAYKESPHTQHIGPMAQDFRAAFGLGMDDKHIATVDADGVALAAIQGLHLRNEALTAQNRELEARTTTLEQRFAAMETLLHHFTSESNLPDRPAH